MKEKYVGKINALKLVMFQKRKMYATRISIVILTMECATIFANPIETVQRVILATMTSVIKTVLMVLMIVAGTNIVLISKN